MAPPWPEPQRYIYLQKGDDGAYTLVSPTGGFTADRDRLLAFYKRVFGARVTLALEEEERPACLH